MVSKLLETDTENAEEGQYTTVAGTAEDVTEIEKTVDDELNTIFMEFGGDGRDTVFKIKVAPLILYLELKYHASAYKS